MAWAQAQLYMSVVLPQPPLQLQKAREKIRGMMVDGIRRCNCWLSVLTAALCLRRAGLNRQRQPLDDCTVDEGDPLNALCEGVD